MSNLAKCSQIQPNIRLCVITENALLPPQSASAGLDSSVADTHSHCESKL